MGKFFFGDKLPKICMTQNATILQFFLLDLLADYLKVPLLNLWCHAFFVCLYCQSCTKFGQFTSLEKKFIVDTRLYVIF